MGKYTIFYFFENPRRGMQARNFTTNVPKILDLKSSSEQIFFRKLSLGAPEELFPANKWENFVGMEEVGGKFKETVCDPPSKLTFHWIHTGGISLRSRRQNERITARAVTVTSHN